MSKCLRGESSSASDIISVYATSQSHSRENRFDERHAVRCLCGVVVHSTAALPVLRARRQFDPSLRPAFFGSRRQTRIGSRRAETDAFTALFRWAGPFYFCLQLTLATVAVLQQGLWRRRRRTIYPETANVFLRDAIGPVRYYELPQWVREGYADYVGKGNSFDYNEARRAFLAGTPEMDWKRSGLYWRFHLLVACLLDHQHWTVEQLLKNPPSETAVEAIVKGE